MHSSAVNGIFVETCLSFPGHSIVLLYPNLKKASIRLGIRFLLSPHSERLDNHFGISVVLVGVGVLTLSRDRLLSALNHSA